MSRVPSCPFRCIVTRQIANGEQKTEQHNHATLVEAWADREVRLQKTSTKKVEVVMVIDESTPAHRGTEPSRSTIKAYRAGN